MRIYKLAVAGFLAVPFLVALAGCPSNNRVAVPNVVGLLRPAAETAIASAGLTVGTVTEEYSDSAPVGQVVSQNPSSGSSVQTGISVSLVVSQGPEPVNVPEVVGMAQAEAQAAIIVARLTVGAVTQSYSDAVAAGHVASQNPAAGASVLPNTAVNLVISLGSESIAVPDVVGLTHAEAEAAITGAGFTVGVVTEDFSDATPGHVASQSPAAGASVPSTSPINLVLSLGPETIAVPNVVGMTQAEAQAAIVNADFTVGTVTEVYVATVAVGSVVSQSPNAGSIASPGTVVNVTISLGPEALTVPDVVGMTQAEAQEAITTAGLVLGAVTEEYSAEIPAGHVISQYPAGGASAALETPVTIVVSLGPQPAEVDVQFSAVPTYGVSEADVEFSDHSSSTVHEITEWLWDFGDGQTSEERHPRHLYTAPGIYSVSLSVRAGDEFFDTYREDLITVMEGAAAVIDRAGGTVTSAGGSQAAIAEEVLPGAAEIRIGDTPDSAIWDTLAAEVPVAGSVTVDAVERSKGDGEAAELVMELRIALEDAITPETELDVYRKGEYEGSWILQESSKALVDASGKVAVFGADRPGLYIVRKPDEYSVATVDLTAYEGAEKNPSVQCKLEKLYGNGPTPIILIHGAGSDTKPDYARWGNFYRWAENGGIDENRFQLWWFLHDTSEPVGYGLGGPNEFQPNSARRLVQQLDALRASGQFPPLPQQFIIVAHSRGGLVSHAFTEAYPEQVLAVITLATPHHGAPFAVPDWVYHVLASKVTLPVVGSVVAQSIVALLYNSDGAIGFGPGKPGSADLAWDNFDGSGHPYGIPLRSFLLLTVNGGGNPLYHFLTPSDGGRPGVGDGDLHVPTMYSSGRAAGYTLWDLNQSSSPVFSDKFVLYGGYDCEALPNLANFDAFGENQGLAAAAGLMTLFESQAQLVSHFEANDGLVPLQSALCLVGSDEEPIYQTEHLLWNTVHTVKKPLNLLTGDITARLPVPANRVRYQEFRGYNHLDIVAGRKSDWDGGNDQDLFGYIRADISSAVEAAPTASLRVSAVSGQDVTIDVSGSHDNNHWQWPAKPLQYQVDWGDGTAVGWTDSPQRSHTYALAGSYTITLRVRDGNGAVSITPATAQVTIDGPRVTSFLINEGRDITSSNWVYAKSTCTGSPTNHMISFFPHFRGASWQPYKSERKVYLPSGNGLKTVYFKVKNALGESAPVYDTIMLDTGPGTGPGETVMLNGEVPMEMVFVPGGTFIMGGTAEDPDAEKPAHQVTVQGFWMSKYEVTKRQWLAVRPLGQIPSWQGMPDVLDDLDSPVVYASWHEVQAFIDELNLHTGMTFRLPSEAEWEYACRANTTTRFYWGDDPNYAIGGAYCWWRYNGLDVYKYYAHPVGLKAANSFGLFDMSGNVSEWCEDDWFWDYTGAPTDGSARVNSPRGPSNVLRGGSWVAEGNFCRSAYRGYGFILPTPLGPIDTGKSSDVGFRLAR